MNSHQKQIFEDRIQQTNFSVAKTNKSSILVIQQFPVDSDSETLFPNVRESVSNIIAFVELGSPAVLEYIIEKSDGIFDAIALDADIKCSFSNQIVALATRRIKKSDLFFYSDLNTWADAGLNFIMAQENGIHDKNILLTGSGPLFRKIADRLHDFGAGTYLYSTEKIDDSIPGTVICKPGDLPTIELVIGGALKVPSLDDCLIPCINRNADIYDIGIGNFTRSQVTAFRAKDAKVYRFDNRAGISSMVLGLFETDYLIKKIMGKVKLKGVELIAGGVMGNEGAIIVDDINHPTQIIGIADGQGFLKGKPESDKERQNLEFVNELIKNP